jgi:hypothetical protein
MTESTAPDSELEDHFRNEMAKNVNRVKVNRLTRLGWFQICDDNDTGMWGLNVARQLLGCFFVLPSAGGNGYKIA